MARKSNKNKKSIEKIVKKTNKLTVFLVLVMFVIGGVAGAFTVKYLTRNDYFKLLGSETETVSVNSTYIDAGAKAVSFGKEIPEEKIEVIGLEDVNTSKPGVYVIKYKVNNFRFKNYTLYRQITVINGEVNNG